AAFRRTLAVTAFSLHAVAAFTAFGLHAATIFAAFSLHAIAAFTTFSLHVLTFAALGLHVLARSALLVLGALGPFLSLRALRALAALGFLRRLLGSFLLGAGLHVLSALVLGALRLHLLAALGRLHAVLSATRRGRALLRSGAA